MLGFVENGVDLSSGPHARRNYALALGRICPEKGFHFALRAAAIARSPLLLAGEVFPYPYHQDYFRKNPNAPYCAYVISPKLQKLQKSKKKG